VPSAPPAGVDDPPQEFTNQCGGAIAGESIELDDRPSRRIGRFTLVQGAEGAGLRRGRKFFHPIAITAFPPAL
jgi:hypothetical protein